MYFFLLTNCSERRKIVFIVALTPGGNMLRVGVYPIKEPMPCSPREARIDPYHLPIPHFPLAAQEAAARIILESQRGAVHGEWVMVSWEQHLHRTILHDIRAHQIAALELRLADTHELHCPHHDRLLLLTCGLHACFCKKSEPAKKVFPKTQVVEKGEKFIMEGIVFLHKHRLILSQDVVVLPGNNIPEDVEIHQIFGPAPELIRLAQHYSTLSTHHRAKGGS